MTTHIRTIFTCWHVLREKSESLGEWKNLNLSFYSFSAFQYVLGYRLLQLHILGIIYDVFLLTKFVLKKTFYKLLNEMATSKWTCILSNRQLLYWTACCCFSKWDNNLQIDMQSFKRRSQLRKLIRRIKLIWIVFKTGWQLSEWHTSPQTGCFLQIEPRVGYVFSNIPYIHFKHTKTTFILMSVYYKTSNSWVSEWDDNFQNDLHIVLTYCFNSLKLTKLTFSSLTFYF